MVALSSVLQTAITNLNWHQKNHSRKEQYLSDNIRDDIYI
jgi:hypothetical protein